MLSYSPLTNVDVGRYDVLDLSAFWNINDSLTVRFGVDNVLDREPETTARSLGRPYDSSKTPAENSAAMAAGVRRHARLRHPHQLLDGVIGPGNDERRLLRHARADGTSLA